MWAFNSLLRFVSSWCQHLIRFQLIGNLQRTSALHTHSEDALHHIGSNRVNFPLAWIFRVFHITVWHIDRQWNTPFPLGFLYGTNFTAGIPGIKLIEPVLDACKIVVGAIGVNGVEIVVDGNVVNAILRKGEVGIKPRQS